MGREVGSVREKKNGRQARDSFDISVGNTWGSLAKITHCKIKDIFVKPWPFQGNYLQWHVKCQVIKKHFSEIMIKWQRKRSKLFEIFTWNTWEKCCQETEPKKSCGDFCVFFKKYVEIVSKKRRRLVFSRQLILTLYHLYHSIFIRIENDFFDVFFPSSL